MKKRQQGFSLVEAMVAIVIITIGFVGIYALTGNSEVYNQRSAQRNAAANIAIQIVEAVAAARSVNVVGHIAGAPYNGVVNLNVNNCQYGNPTANTPRAQGRPMDSADFDIFFIQWCSRLNAELGISPNAVRTLSATQGVATPAGTVVDLVTLTILERDNNISLVEVFQL